MRFTLIFALLIGCTQDYGVQREVHTEGFTQPERDGGVDILWVIDDSSSMYEEQAQLEAHAESFISLLSSVPVDFHLGLVSTDLSIEQPGVLLGEVLSDDTPQLVDAFIEQIRNEEEGSRDEYGFDAAALAADPAGLNNNFNRKDADLEIVFFSDEDDHSDMETVDFVSDLQAGRPGKTIVVNAIVGDPPEGCASIYGAADTGQKYIDAQTFTEGARESICSLDYEAMLARIAQNVLGLETTFALSSVPDPGSLEVRVDAILVAERSEHGWSFEPGLNAVVFDGYAVPQPGAEIVITYLDWIGPTQEDTGE